MYKVLASDGRMHSPSQGRLGKGFLAPLLIGILFGFGFGVVFLNINSDSVIQSSVTLIEPLQPIHLETKHNNNSNASTQNQNETKIATQHQQPNTETNLNAETLEKQVKVLCWIMTSPANHHKKAIHVKRTWGKRCNKLVFMSSEDDPDLPSIALPNVQEGRDFLWAKTKEAFKYVYEKYSEEADWFMKADDDTFVVVENLRYLLKDYDTKSPIYFGCKFNLTSHIKNGYMSGGAGYVLSKEALRKFVEEGLSNKTKCWADHSGAEDLELGKCLENVGVEAGDSRDALGRYRFLPLSPEKHLDPGGIVENWYRNYIYYPQKEGMECCSDMAISFHYISPNTIASPNINQLVSVENETSPVVAGAR